MTAPYDANSVNKNASAGMLLQWGRNTYYYAKGESRVLINNEKFNYMIATGAVCVPDPTALKPILFYKESDDTISLYLAETNVDKVPKALRAMNVNFRHELGSNKITISGPAYLAAVALAGGLFINSRHYTAPHQQSRTI